jgi:hypothetical protein
VRAKNAACYKGIPDLAWFRATKERIKVWGVSRADSYGDRHGWGLGANPDFLCPRWFPTVQAQQISTISGRGAGWPFLQRDFGKTKRKEENCCKAPSTRSFVVSCTLSSSCWLIPGSDQEKKKLRTQCETIRRTWKGIVTCKMIKEAKIMIKVKL